MEAWIFSPDAYFRDAKVNFELKARDIVRNALVEIGNFVLKPGDGVTMHPAYHPDILERACELLREAGWDAELRVRFSSKFISIETGQSGRDEAIATLKEEWTLKKEEPSEKVIGIDIKAPLTEVAE